MKVVLTSLGLALGLVVGGALAAELRDVVVKAIRELGDDKHFVREQAERLLFELSASNHVAVLAECVIAYQNTKDPEVEHRLRSVMRRVVDKRLYRLPRAFLGIRMNNVFIGGGGHLVINGVNIPAGAIWVGGVIEGTAAEKAGIQANDFILQVDDRRWSETNHGEFTAYIQSKNPGQKVKLVVLRGEETNRMEVVLGDLPPEQSELVYTDEGSRQYFEAWFRAQLGSDPPDGETETEPRE